MENIQGYCDIHSSLLSLRTALVAVQACVCIREQFL